MKKIDRRSFVKSTTISSGALMTVPFSLDAMANSFNNRKLKLAVIGCGGRGTGAVIQALKADKDVELVSMADAFKDNLENSLKSILKEFEGIIKVKVKEKNRFIGFDAYKKAIDLADVVILATPPGFRPQHFEYAINNDKHVFMEKPVATDPNGVRKVLKSVKLAEIKKLNVVVGLQRRYQKSYRAISEFLKNGKIGKIISGQVYWNSGGVWVRKRESGQTEMEYQMRNWYYFNWLCGDHILEQHIHNIDVANWFVGGYPTEAQGMGGREVRNGIDHGEIFDHHFVEFSYANGAVISSQCRHQTGCMNKVEENFQGTKGTVSTRKGIIKNLDGDVSYNYNGIENPSSSMKNKGGGNPYQVEHDKLFASIRNGDVIADAENGAKSTLTAIMGRMATYSGKVITWDQALNSDLQLMPEMMTWGSTPPTLPDSEGRYKIPVPGKTKFY